MSDEKVVVTNRGFTCDEINFYVGKYLDKMYDAFEQKKLVGNQCPECEEVFFPPRKICGKCKITIPLEENWVDLSETGILKSYTATPYKINERGSRTGKKNKLLGLVQLDGTTNSGIVYRLLKMEPDEVEIGMKLKAVWTKNPKGEPMDIKGFTKA